MCILCVVTDRTAHVTKEAARGFALNLRLAQCTLIREGLPPATRNRVAEEGRRSVSEGHGPFGCELHGSLVHPRTGEKSKSTIKRAGYYINYSDYILIIIIDSY